ncbi:MAG: ABC transporter ATP-binding protein [bacterium]|nr:ABC transporter ATP-binding protein [bacterium]
MLQLYQVHLSLGGLKILQQLSLEIQEGKITGLIGPNGAGKSTVFNVVTGLIPFASGSVKLRGQEILGASPDQVSRLGLMRTFQDSVILSQITVLENLISASPLLRDISLAQVFFRSAQTRQRKAEAGAKALELLGRVGLEGKANSLAKELSYGQTKLVEILKVMMSEAELIFLDEPFSGLYPEMIKVIQSLIYELVKKGKTIVLVEHNMKLIEEVCDRVIVLDFGEKIAEGTFAEVRKNKKVIEAYLGN